MAYISNPYMGKVRRLAVNDVNIRKLSYQQTALKYGVTKSAICKWMKRATADHREFIYTRSSRPHFHPKQLSDELVNRIIEVRKQRNKCAPVVHSQLRKEGIIVSLSSVERVLRRYSLVRKPKQANWKVKVPRPMPVSPGKLVEMDTMHVVKLDHSRFFIYAVIDLYSRLGYAEYQTKINQKVSIRMALKARNYFGFPFEVMQTDNGPEFKQNFSYYLGRNNIEVRHSRVRKPNDNAHIERFIRTLQDECFEGRDPKEKTAQKKLNEYLDYYNNERMHLSLNMQTPREFVSKLLS